MEEKSSVDTISESVISLTSDDILRHIISLIPCSESAAKTRLLSTRWRYLCSMNCVQHEQVSRNYAMGRIILGYVAPAGDPTKPLNYPWKLVLHSTESGLVLVATLGAKNRKLHLDFSHGDCDSLWSASVFFSPAIQPCSPKILPTIFRSIRLTSVDHSSRVILMYLLQDSHFRYLESIEITNSPHLSYVRIHNDVNLVHLSILDCKLDTLKMNANNHRSFHYRGKGPDMSISASHSFKDVMLDLRVGPSQMYYLSEYRGWPLLHSIKDAECITICRWTFEMMIGPRSQPFSHFRFLKELWWIDNSMEDENIDTLITFLEACLTLEKLFVTVDPTCYCLPRKDIDMSRKSGCLQLRHLEMVKMDGFEREEDEVLLAHHIFNIARMEPAVVATSRDSCTRRLVRAHPNRRVFVEETDSEILNTKHVHTGI